MKVFALSAALALPVGLAAPAGAQITVDSTLNASLLFGDPGAAGEQVVANFDASASDKLVVVVSSEHAHGLTSALTIDSVEYNGRPMIEAVQEDTVPGTTALFYLDDPGAAGEIRLFTTKKNGGLVTIYALSGTEPGVAATSQSTTNSVGITPTLDNSLVIAGILDGGQASNGNGAGSPTSDAPLTEVQAGVWGTNLWGGHGCGYQLVASAGPVTPTFTTAGPNLLRTVAAVFEGPSDYLLSDTTSISLTAGGVATFSLSAGPTFAGLPYLLMGSLSGTSPGIPINNDTTLPLNPDGYWVHTLTSPGPPLGNSFGALDVDGKATVTFTIPPNTTQVLAGLTASHAFVAIELLPTLLHVPYVSDPVDIALLP